MIRPALAAAVLLLASGSLAGCTATAVQAASDGSGASATDDGTSDAQSQPQDATQSLPEGFHDTGLGVGLKWDDNSCADSSGVIACMGAMVYAEKDCSTLYLEANVLDDSGTILGFSNAMVNSISAGGEAHAEFNYTQTDATKIQLTKADCY